MRNVGYTFVRPQCDAEGMTAAPVETDSKDDDEDERARDRMLGYAQTTSRAAART